jgi:FKBP-type peptidyl-prolyl cis-trans isomerase 2
MTLKEKDFIEIEFTGSINDGEIFDSNIKEDIEKAGLKTPAEPFAFSLGQGMFLKGIDDFLIGKEIGKQYDINLDAKDAFGKRDTGLIKLIPLNVFKQHKINPIPGAMLNFDGRPARILSASGGRVRIDFNNPLAGKDVKYKVKVLKKLEKIDDKVNALNQFLFRKKFQFEIKDKKLILDVDQQLLKFVELFKEKFKEILGLDLEIREVESKDSKKESKQ